jgi:hypothetical protein
MAGGRISETETLTFCDVLSRSWSATDSEASGTAVRELATYRPVSKVKLSFNRP